LDAGCGYGRFMELLRRKFPDSTLKGIDFSKSEIADAKEKGLDVKQGDFEKGIDFSEKKFDIVYAGEIIEHLYNPDFFLEEINRVLKDNGFLVLSTPNLLSWFNRILALIGVQPLFLEPSTKSKLVGAGILRKFKKESQPVGHVRIFTLEALKDLLKMNHFQIVEIKGSIFDEGLPKPALLFDRLFTIFPGMASQLVILARKVQ
jgi:2-polyprenyl-3-methyl-5-hydroxy-6-metoxy-1,4-benzoquinol methylase